MLYKIVVCTYLGKSSGHALKIKIKLFKQIFHLTGWNYKLASPSSLRSMQLSTTRFQDKELRTKYPQYLSENNALNLDCVNGTYLTFMNRITQILTVSTASWTFIHMQDNIRKSKKHKQHIRWIEAHFRINSFYFSSRTLEKSCLLIIVLLLQSLIWINYFLIPVHWYK